MANKVKVPGGAFYAGDGLTVDPINRTVSVGGGDVTTPDWNQNDATASDYIKNRPFYETDPVETVMLPETTVTIATGVNLLSDNFPYLFEIGRTYTIIFDGVETEYTAYDPGTGYVYVGYDLQAVMRGTGFAITAGDGAASLITKDSAFVGQHTISIKGSLTDIVKIPDKYLNRHTHILGASFWETKSKSELIDIVNQFNAGDVFTYQYDIGAASLLLSASYSETAGFNFVYIDNYAIRTIHGDVGNWTTKYAEIAFS